MKWKNKGHEFDNIAWDIAQNFKDKGKKSTYLGQDCLGKSSVQ